MATPSLAQLFFGRFANVFRARRAARRRQRPQLCTLEPRLLLSADLIGSVEFHPDAAPILPGDGEQATVVVRNVGNAAASGPAKVSLYASADGVLDANDVLLATGQAPKLKAAASSAVNLGFSAPELAPGEYSLIAKVDSDNKVAEGNEANNVAVGPKLVLRWMFGNVQGHGNQTLTVRDADGTGVLFSLTGPGTGEVVLDHAQWDLRVTGTSDSSVLSVLTLGGGDGRVALDDIQVGGALGVLLAPTADLTGTLSLQGSLKTGLVLGSLHDAVIAAPTGSGSSLPGLSLPGIAILGDVTNSEILLGANLGADGQLGGSGANADSYSAATLGDLLISGSMLASCVRVGQDPVDGIFDNGNDVLRGGTVHSITVLGDVSDDSCFVASDFPDFASIHGRPVNTDTDPRFIDDIRAHAPAISINDVTVTEGNTGTVGAAFSVGLSRASSQIVTVDFATRDGTASAGSDYVARTGTVTFLPGETSKSVSIAVNGDLLNEADEIFEVNLSNAQNAVIADAQGIGTIANDDPLPILTISDASVLEGDAGTAALTFTVGLNTASGQTVLVSFSTADDTATDGNGEPQSDYVANAGTLVFNPGQTSKQITVTVNADGVLETDEVFRVNLLAATNATIDDGQGVGTILNDDFAPVAQDDSFTTQEDTPLILSSADLVANDSDADGDSLTVTAVQAGPYTHGTVTLLAGVVTYTPDANYNGQASFTYRVSDGQGGSDEGLVEVTVEPVNDAPVAADDNFAVQGIVPPRSPGVLIGNVLANDTDVDGDELSVLLPLKDPSTTFDTDYGTLTLERDGDLFWSVDKERQKGDKLGDAGRILSLAEGEVAVVDKDADGFDLLYVASDDPKRLSGDEAAFQLSITGVNDAPEASSNSFSTYNDVALVLSDFLAIHAFDWDNGDTLSVALGTAAHGTVFYDESSDTLTYTPDPSYAGPDSFEFTVTDSYGASGSAVIDVIVLQQFAPDALDGTLTTDEDTAAIGALQATDQNGDALTFVIVDGPQHGTVELLDASIGAFTYSPAPDFNGDDSFTFRANDGGRDSNLATVFITVNPVNDAPVAVDDYFPLDGVVPPFTPGVLIGNVLANDIDIDGDELRVALPLKETSTEFDTDYGSLTLESDGDLFWSIDKKAIKKGDKLGDAGRILSLAEGEVVVVDKDADGVALVYTVTDEPKLPDGDEGTFQLTITGVNDAPEVSGDSLATYNDAAVVLTAFLETHAIDWDHGDTLTVAFGNPAHGSVVYDASADTLTYTPDPTYAGPDSFEFTATDSHGASANAVIDVTVLQQFAPDAVDGTLTTDEDMAAIGTLQATDQNGDALIFSIVGGPQHGTVVLLDVANGEFAYSPATDFNGEDSFTFRANDGGRDSNLAAILITVNPVNDVPVAQDAELATSEDVAVTGMLVATDVDGDALSYGIVSNGAKGTVFITDAATGAFTYTPHADANGTDSFTFMVNDGQTDSNVATVSLTIAPVNDEPVAQDATLSTSENVALVGMLVATDVDGDALSYAVVSNGSKGAAVITDAATGTFTYTPDANANGTDSFTFMVNDGQADSNVATVTVTILNNEAAPVAQNATLSTSEDVAVAGTLVATDADGDALSYAVVSNGAKGTAFITNAATGAFTYTPNANANGTDSFTFRANDGQADSNVATVSVTIAPVNDAPVAQAGALSTSEDVAKAGTLIATDVDGNPLTYSVVAQASKGNVVVTNPTTGAYTYTPNANANGTDSFTFRVNDGQANSNVATVTVTVTPVNDAPVALPGALAATEDVAKAGTLIATDVDGDPLTFMVVQQASKGNVLVTNPATGAYTYTPNPNANGSDSFTFRAIDGQASSTVQAVTIAIAPVNDAPVAQAGTLSASEDVAKAGTLIATDVDGNPLTYSVVAQGSKGNVVITNPSTGAYTYTPSSNANGADSFTFKASDGSLESNIAAISITIAPVNDSPVAASDAYSTTQGATLAIAAASGVLANDTDVEGTALTAVLVTGPTHGVLSLASDGAFAYAPSANFAGSDSFAYQASDGVASSNTATVLINVIRDPSKNHVPSFSLGDGMVLVDVAGQTDVANDVVLQADGRIVAAGNGLVRLNIDGSLDPSLDGDGKVNTGSLFANALVIQPDGKMVLAGQSGGDFALARYNTDGSFDTSFDTDGMVTTDFGALQSDSGQALALQADGKIVVAGLATVTGSNTDFALARYNTNGSLDTSFDTDGRVTVDLGSNADQVSAVLIQPVDGKILVGGRGPSDFALARLNTNGSLDTSFGTGGKVTTPIGSSSDVLWDLALQPDGKIVAAGSAAGTGGGLALVRYNANGSLDTTFGTGGKVIAAVLSTNDSARGVLVQPDGKIVVVGTDSTSAVGQSSSVLLARFNTNGTLDTSFDGDGKLALMVGPVSSSLAMDAVLQSDGRIVVVGQATGTATDMAFARVNPNGTLDLAFDPTTVNTLDASPTYTRGGAAVVLDGNVRVYDADLALVGHYGGASLTLSRLGGANASDVFSAKAGGTLSTLTPGSLVVSGTIIGTVANSGGTLLLTFNANATQALVESAMQQIAYSNTSSTPPATVQVNWSFSDGNSGSQGTGGALSATGSTLVHINNAPTGALTISGTATEGQTLTAVSTLADADGLGTIGYQWQMSSNAGATWTNVATGPTLALTDAHLGRQIRVLATYTDGGGTPESVASAATTAVANLNAAPSFVLGDGKVTAAVVGTGSGGDVGDALLQPDGKLVVVGDTSNISATNNFALARYNTDGSLDTSFDGDGKLTTSFTPSTTGANAVALQPDGKIVVAGGDLNGNLSGIVLARYNTNGSLDTSFDGDGKLQLNPTTSNDGASAMLIQSDGKIVLAGGSTFSSLSTDSLLVRLNADGSYDTSFSFDGVQTINLGSFDSIRDLALQPDGKIVTVGTTTSFGDDIALARFNADGSLDTSFGTGGTVISDLGASTEFAAAVALQSDGKIVVVGSTNSNSTIALVRYNANGSLDTTFDTDGKVFTDFSPGSDFGFSVLVQSDGKIVVTGSALGGTTNSFALARYNTDGTLDTSFDGDGKVLTDFAGGSQAMRVLQQADGRLVAVGEAQLTNNEFAVARYNTNGSLDLFYDTRVNTLDATPTYNQGAPAVVLDANVRVYDPDLALIGNYGGASLTIARSGGANAQDQFSAASGGTLSALTQGASFSVSGTAIGTVTSNANGTLVLTFNANATQVLLDSTLQQIAYRNSSTTPPASVNLAWTFSDGNVSAQGAGGAMQTTGNTTVTITQLNNAPVGTVTIAGTPLEGQVLTAASTLVDYDGLGAITYQWQSSSNGSVWSVIGSGPTFTLVQAQVGLQVRVLASYTDGGGTAESVVSAPTAAIANLNTPPTGSVGITGSATENQILTATNTLADIDGLGPITYQWQISNGTGWFNVSTGTTLTLSDGHVGHQVRVVASYVDLGNTPESMASAPTATVTNGNEAPTFALGDGMVLVDVAGQTDVANDVVLQADGRIVAAGNGLVRLNIDGSLDPSLDGDGKVNTGSLFANALVIQPDGKMVLAGQSGGDFALARYNTDGSFDTSFDTDGMVTTDFGALQSDSGQALALQADGKIVVAGLATVTGSNTDFALARYNTNGSLDTSFDTDGRVTVDLGSNADQVSAVLIQPVDGKILVGGRGPSDFALARLNTNGSLDTSFGTGGKVTTPIGSSSDVLWDLALQPDGKIVAAGSAAGTGGGLALVRYNANGSLDTTFGTGGKVIAAVLSTNDSARGVLVQPDGKIVVVGTDSTSAVGQSSSVLLARFNTNGTLDTSFDGDGKLALMVGPVSSSLAMDAVLQSDGRIVVVGQATGTATDMAFARVNPNGTLDLAFDPTTVNTLDASPTYTRGGAAVVLDGNVRVYDADLALVGHYGGASLTLSRLGGANASDVFSAKAGGTLSTLTPGSLVVSGTIIGTVANSGGTLLLTFNANATQALVESAMQQIAYSNTSSTPPATVQVNWSFSDGNSGSQGTGGALSATGSTLVHINNAPTGALTISGTATEGQTLTAVSTLADADGLGTIGYQWQMSSNAGATWTNVATGPTLALTDAHLGRQIRVLATYTDGGGTPESVASAATTAVANLNAAPSFVLGDGKVTAAVVGTGSGGDVGDALLQPDGKLVVVGDTSNISATNNFALARYNTDGSLDTSFDGDGKLTTSFTPSTTGANAVALQPDGKIVVAGGDLNGNLSGIVLARYNTNGSLDTSFDGDGKLQLNPTTSNDGASAMLIQSDGKIVLAGGSTFSSLSTDSLLVRLNADGSYDTSFSFDGVQTINLGSFDSIRDLALQPDGKIVTVGTTTSFGDDIALARFNADGSLDTSFGTGGTVISDLGASTEFAAAVALQSDGKIVVVGSTNSNSTIALVRYNANGSLDTTFDTDGKVFTDFSPGSDFGFSVLVQSDGKIVVTGSALGGTTNSFALARYNTDGTLDTSFDGDGKVLTDFAGGSQAMRVLQQADGRLVAVGEAQLTNNEFAVARYNTNGSLDLFYDTRVNTLDATPTYNQGAPAVVLDANVRVYDPDLALIGNYGGASLTIARSGGANAQDQFSAASGGTLSALTQGASFSVSGTAIGTVTSNANGTLVLTFNANATQALLDSTLQQIAYRNSSTTPPASVNLAWTFSDGNVSAQGAGGAMQTTGNTTVTIIPAMLASGSADGASNPSAVTQQQLDAMAAYAIAAWAERLGEGDPRLTGLENASIVVGDLGGAALGSTDGSTITIDMDAAGYGWFVDLTPSELSESFEQMDLVTVVTHEIGHLLGFTHEDADLYAVMRGDLAPGVRYKLDPPEPEVAWDEPPADWAPSGAGANFADFDLSRV